MLVYQRVTFRWWFCWLCNPWLMWVIHNVIGFLPTIFRMDVFFSTHKKWWFFWGMVSLWQPVLPTMDWKNDDRVESLEVQNKPSRAKGLRPCHWCSLGTTTLRPLGREREASFFVVGFTSPKMLWNQVFQHFFFWDYSDCTSWECQNYIMFFFLCGNISWARMPKSIWPDEVAGPNSTSQQNLPAKASHSNTGG